MQIPFSKYHGTGNDFIIIDNRLLQLQLEENIIAHFCHRRFGIGADGLMLLNNSEYYPFEMQYYNADGKLGSMCGNGGRCIVAFARNLQLFSNKVDFMAFDGVHSAEVFELLQNKTMVKLEMKDVSNSNIEFLEEGAFVLDTGSPHYVAFVENVENINVFEEGGRIRNEPRFFKRKGVNVNFAQECEDYIYVRTFERGVEDETYSCGTGVVASALIYAKKSNLENVQVKTKGGNLQVYLKQTATGFKRIFLQGYAIHSFDGVFDTDLI